MVNLDDAITARLESHGETFEILLDPAVFDLVKQGKKFDIVEYMAVEDVFKNAGKGTRPAEDKIKEAFGTEDIGEIARKIVEKGEIQITAEGVSFVKDGISMALSCDQVLVENDYVAELPNGEADFLMYSSAKITNVISAI
ncbi:MAG: hypothetical protein IJX35_01045, partial [Candidatus Methanomethylophilaceae archaeon]|nr:hypothetical protein [Candidatus Methanomethylophilaceae archaeon]